MRSFKWGVVALVVLAVLVPSAAARRDPPPDPCVAEESVTPSPLYVAVTDLDPGVMVQVYAESNGAPGLQTSPCDGHTWDTHVTTFIVDCVYVNPSPVFCVP